MNEYEQPDRRDPGAAPSRRWHVQTAVLRLAAVLLATSGLASADEMNVTLEAGSYEIVAQPDSTVRIEMAGYSYPTAPGVPTLPYRVFMVALPPDAEVTSIEVRGENETELRSPQRIEPVPMPDSAALADYDRPAPEIWHRTHDRIYTRDKWYPYSGAGAAGYGTMPTFRYARVVYNPFSWAPQSGRLLYRPTANVRIEYEHGAVLTEYARTPRERRAEAARGLKLFVNYRYMHRSYFPMPPGDMNYDSAVTAADVIYFVAKFFENKNDALLALSGDLNCDGTITYADIMALAGFVLKGDKSPRALCLESSP